MGADLQEAQDAPLEAHNQRFQQRCVVGGDGAEVHADFSGSGWSWLAILSKASDVQQQSSGLANTKVEENLSALAWICRTNSSICSKSIAQTGARKVAKFSAGSRFMPLFQGRAGWLYRLRSHEIRESGIQKPPT